MKNVIIQIIGATGSGKGVFSAILQKALAEHTNDFIEIDSITACDNDEKTSISVMWKPKVQTFKNLAGFDVEGSQDDYNEGFIKGCITHKELGYHKAQDAIFPLLNSVNTSFQYGLNDASKFFAAQHKKK